MSSIAEVYTPQPEVFPWSLESLQQFGMTRDEAGITLLFRDSALPFYIPETEYHNSYEHIEEGFLEATRLCQLARQQGYKVDILLVAVAYLGHDTGYNHDLFKDFDLSKWGVKEEYHAHITATILESLGMEDDFIGRARKCILTTGHNVKCETIEEEITQMADTSNVPSPYTNYVLKSCEFFKESILRGADLDLDSFRTIATKVLGTYFSGIKILRNFDLDENGRSYVERAHRNMERFSKETPQSILRILGENATRFADVLLRKKVDDS